MHRCVCIWQYILQNYNYKLHFQNLSIYHIPHVSIGTLAAENLDVCTACDPWDSNIQLTMVKDQRSGPGMPAFPRQRGLIYFCQSFLPCMMPSMDGWRDGWMDGKSFTTTTSFTVCNNYSQTLCIKCWVSYWDLIKFHYFAYTTERGDRGWKQAQRQGEDRVRTGWLYR
jgi:hypothetical protein